MSTVRTSHSLAPTTWKSRGKFAGEQSKNTDECGADLQASCARELCCLSSGYRFALLCSTLLIEFKSPRLYSNSTKRSQITSVWFLSRPASSARTFSNRTLDDGKRNPCQEVFFSRIHGLVVGFEGLYLFPHFVG
jgi:hypothetical protein